MDQVIRFGTVDIEAGGVPTGSTKPVFNVIIPQMVVTDTTFTENWVLLVFFLMLDLKMTPKIPILSLETIFKGRIGRKSNAL